MHQKPPFKILGLSDSVIAQKSLIFIFVRVIISPEKNPRKPVLIIRAEIGDFKLLKHIKLLVTDSNCETIEQLGSCCSSAMCLFVGYTKAKYTGSIRPLRIFDEEMVTNISLTGAGMCL